MSVDTGSGLGADILPHLTAHILRLMKGISSTFSKTDVYCGRSDQE